MGCGSSNPTPTMETEKKPLKNDVVILENGKQKQDFVFKILLLGDSSVGKSSILSRLLDDQFTMSHISTLGMEFRSLDLEVKGKIVKFQVWDTAGQERYRSITQGYYRDANGVVLIFDITSKQTFVNISNWVNELQKKTEKIKIILVGNKSDLADTRTVKYEDAINYAKKIGVRYYESSAKENTNINEIFKQIALDIYENMIENK